ncbi:hypothetical protein ACQ4PT_066254 [Festuca glaucescens]
MFSVVSDGRPLADAPPTGSFDNESPWASVPANLARLVGSQVLVGHLLDYIRFRAVCLPWRSVTISPRQWMMLPKGHALHAQDGSKRFFNLSTAAFVRARVDLLGAHEVLCQVEGLLLLRLQGPEDTICLLHPFTGDVADLQPH